MPEVHVESMPIPFLQGLHRRNTTNAEGHRVAVVHPVFVCHRWGVGAPAVVDTSVNECCGAGTVLQGCFDLHLKLLSVLLDASSICAASVIHLYKQLVGVISALPQKNWSLQVREPNLCDQAAPLDTCVLQAACLREKATCLLSFNTEALLVHIVWLREVKPRVCEASHLNVMIETMLQEASDGVQLRQNSDAAGGCTRNQNFGSSFEVGVACCNVFDDST
mmetsp:Transcript_57332/g.136273  ORF Transcript_57332/g.136273 Transcript_57332/m.136273 type:complete len:221 (+) Transcript_57332:267-929(+)